jgi:Eco57I restriction-modification methylase
MDLETCLSSIHALSDLPRLVSALGHQPLWETCPPEAWHRSSNDSSAIQVVGQTGPLPWFATESPNPERTAARLAGRLSRRGRIGLVLALHPAARRLAIAVAFGRIPHIELDLARPHQEAVVSLAKLAGKPEGGTMAFAVLAADALSAEPVGSRFFREFRTTLDRVAAGLPDPMHPDDRHGLALLQLTRVLFLYFIQTKGWLGARPRFLAEEVDRCLARRRQIHRDLLRPLFFGTLNQPATSRSRVARGFGAMPFLNGGLFEPHRLERRYCADIPNEIWRDAFDRLFERFHFTVSERDRSGVAPDMLGRVFEGVMAPEARHASGTFYTPASLVRELLDAALVALIAERTGWGDREAERHMRNRNPRAAGILGTLTLLDPAVGSGAFLLGALERLASIEPDEHRRSVRKRYVLQHNLFGVDQSAAAVRLTELRLWLAVIADDPADRADAVSPLPNLDCLIRQGDSLFDPLGWAAGVAVQRPGRTHELAMLRQQAVTASGPDKHSLARRLRAIEARMVDQSLCMAEERHRSEIAECLQQARANDLFGQRRGLDHESRTTLLGLRTGLRQVRHARRKLARDGEVPWFHYQSHFADVFAAGGFDIVIGNPPWLRSEQLSSPLRSRLAGRYHWWRSNVRCYGNGPDLAVAFLERGLELAAPAGVVAMLVPAKITSAGYGAAARHALASTTRLHAVADLTGSPQAEFEATVYPLAIVAGKAAPLDGQRVRTTLSLENQRQVLQAGLRGGGPWILVCDEVRDAVAELEQIQPKVGENTTCHLGLKTGANRIFLNPPAGLEAEVLRWAIRGRDLRPFLWQSRTRLLWTHDDRGHPRRGLPPRATAYLSVHHGELRARKDFKGGAAWAVFRTQPAVARYRVVWADLARHLVAVALSKPSDREHIPLNSCYVAPMRTGPHAERLTAWLNSTWLRAAARTGAVPAASGFARFNAQVVARLPLPDGVLADGRLSRIAREGRAGRAVQEELDDIAAQHLGLSASAQIALRSVVDVGAQHRR